MITFFTGLVVLNHVCSANCISFTVQCFLFLFLFFLASLVALRNSASEQDIDVGAFIH